MAGTRSHGHTLLPGRQKAVLGATTVSQEVLDLKGRRRDGSWGVGSGLSHNL